MQKKKEEKMSLFFSFLSYARRMYVRTYKHYTARRRRRRDTHYHFPSGKKKEKGNRTLAFFPPVTFRVWVIHCRSCPAVHTYT